MIAAGPVFVTRTGRPLDRSNIWHDMKALCREAGVAEGKVFPHNLRHLFVLWAGEGYRAAGGYSGAFRCEHDADLHYGVRGDAQETAGADAAGDMKNHGMMIPW